MYDTKVGQWLSEDPLGFQAGDANLRRYVENDPANFVDPTGFQKKKPPTNPDDIKWGDFKDVDPFDKPKDGGDGEAGIIMVPVPGFTVSGKIVKPGEAELFIKPGPSGKLTQSLMSPDSWATPLAKANEMLLEHEKLHAKISQEVAKYYAEYLKKWKMTVKYDPKLDPKAVQAFMKKEMERQYDEIMKNWKKMDDAINGAYDKDSEHSVNDDKQKDWEKNWKDYVKKMMQQAGYPQLPQK